MSRAHRRTYNWPAGCQQRLCVLQPWPTHGPLACPSSTGCPAEQHSPSLKQAKPVQVKQAWDGFRGHATRQRGSSCAPAHAQGAAGGQRPAQRWSKAGQRPLSRSPGARHAHAGAAAGQRHGQQEPAGLGSFQGGRKSCVPCAPQELRSGAQLAPAPPLGPAGCPRLLSRLSKPVQGALPTCSRARAAEARPQLASAMASRRSRL